MRVSKMATGTASCGASPHFEMGGKRRGSMFHRGLSLLILGSVAVVAGCQKEPPSLAPPRPPEVIITRPVVQEVADFEEFTGKTEAVETVQVRARVSGYLDKVSFEEGADVQKGDLLFQIDPRPLQAHLARPRAH